MATRVSSGIEVPGWLGPRPGGGYHYATDDLQKAAQTNAKLLADIYGYDVEIRFNSDGKSGGAFAQLPAGGEVGIGVRKRGDEIVYDGVHVTKNHTVSTSEYGSLQSAIAWLQARSKPLKKTRQARLAMNRHARPITQNPARRVRVGAYRRQG